MNKHVKEELELENVVKDIKDLCVEDVKKDIKVLELGNVQNVELM